MSDDHAAHAISAYGGRLAKIAPTPNLDRLAKRRCSFQKRLLYKFDLLTFPGMCTDRAVQPYKRSG